MTPSGYQAFTIGHVRLPDFLAFGHFSFLGYVDLNHLSQPKQK